MTHIPNILRALTSMLMRLETIMPSDIITIRSSQPHEWDRTGWELRPAPSESALSRREDIARMVAAVTTDQAVITSPVVRITRWDDKKYTGVVVHIQTHPEESAILISLDEDPARCVGT